MFSTLISTDELHRHLSDPDWRIFDCRFTLSDVHAGRKHYQQGHIAGALYADLEQDLSGPISTGTGRHPLPAIETLAATFSRWGIGAATQVVVYDDNFGAIAGRLWWLLRYLGHDAVALLDGGYPKWLRENKPVNNQTPSPDTAQFIPRVRNAMLVDTAVVEARHRDPAYLIVDARAEERFLGHSEPLDKVAGHIPGAVNRPFDDNLELGGTFLSHEELRHEFYRLLDGRSPEQVMMSCGSGVTACHNVLAMEHAGLSGAKLYAGSWSAWISDPQRPVATGTE